MNKLTQLIVGIVILGLIAGGFYWYQLRPSNIRKGCTYTTVNALKNDGGAAASDYNTLYQFCLHKKGL